jgi:hypothetical protein
MPGQGFKCVGAANTVLFWNEERAWVGGCEGMGNEGFVELSEIVECGVVHPPSSVIRESCSSRKLGSGVPRSCEREDALTTSFNDVVMIAWDKGEASMAKIGSFPREACQDVRCPNHICHSFPEIRKLYSRTPIAATSRLRKTGLGMPVISCLKGMFRVPNRGAKNRVPGSELECLIVYPFVRQHDPCCEYAHHIIFDQIGASILQRIPETCPCGILSVYDSLRRDGEPKDVP